MEIIAVNGVVRSELGKKGTKADRNAAMIPCVMYGGTGNVHFKTTLADVRHLIYTPNFKTAEITLDNGAKHTAILKGTAFHPVNEAILHIDFLELLPNKPVRVEVPLRFKGVSPGVKAGGKLLQSVRRVKIKCTPEDLVDELFVNISQMELGSTSRVREIEVPKGVEVMMSPSIPVAVIEIPRALRSAQTAAANAANKKK